MLQNKSIVFIAFLYYVLIAKSVAQSQNCQCFIQGRIVDASNNLAIPGAIIQIKGTKTATVSDEKGFYKISNLCVGSYEVSCKILGYTPQTFALKIDHGQEQHFHMDDEEHHLENVDIVAQKLEVLTQSQTTINKTFINENSAVSLAELLNKLPGVSALQTGLNIAKPIVHGLHSNRLLIMNNGLRLEGQQWGTEHAPEVDISQAKNISLIKGAAGVRYGAEAIAGVIVITPDLLPDSTKLTGTYNLAYFTNGRQVSNNISLQNAYKNNHNVWAWRAQLSYRNSGNKYTANYNLDNTGTRELNYSVTAGFKSKKHRSELNHSLFNNTIGLFTGSHIGNLTDLKDAITRARPLAIYTPSAFARQIDRPRQEIQHFTNKYQGTWYTNIGELSVTAGHQYNFRREIDVLRGSRNLVQRFSLNSFTNEVLLNHKPIFNKITGTIGLANQYQRNVSSGTVQTPLQLNTLIPNFENTTAGIFIIEKLVKNKWDWELGLRQDYRNLLVYRLIRNAGIEKNAIVNWNTTLNSGTNYRPTDSWIVSLNFGTAWRAPNVNELYSDGVHHGTASYEKGNENLKVEKALNLNTTIQYNKKDWQIELHAYVNQINNFIYQAATGRTLLTIRGAFPEFWQTQTTALLQGFDYTQSWTFHKNISWQLKYNYLHAQDTRTQQPLIFMAPNRLDNSLIWERNGTKAQIGVIHVTKQNRYPKQLILSEIPSSEIEFENFGGDFLPPPPSYTLVSAQIGHTWSLKRSNSIQVLVGGTNLTNISYRDYLNRLRYFADDQGRNLTFRVNYSF